MSALPPILHKELEQLNRYRHHHLLFCLGVWLFGCSFVCAFLWFGFFQFTPWQNRAIFIMVFLSAVFGLWLLQIFDRDYRQKVKKTFLYRLASVLGLKYSPHGNIRVGDLYDHKIIPSYGSADKEDGFSGRIRGRKISLQEVRFSDVIRNAPGKPMIKQVFLSGLVVKINLKRKLKFETVIVSARAPSSILWEDLTRPIEAAEKVGLPSKFEKTYKAFSSHQVESRYILDPAFMERLLDLFDHLKCKRVWASFQKSELLIIAAYDKDLFEANGMLKPLYHEDLISTYMELKTFTQIIEILDLNPDTGL